jgi:23S rRNA (guanosine2251-2'-O)-methyltransferase
LRVDSFSALDHILEHKPERILKLFVDSNRIRSLGQRAEKLLGKARQLGLQISETNLNSSSEISAELRDFPYLDLKAFLNNSEDIPHRRVLVLDHLQDPQNFGALCRTAEALGWSAVVFPKDRAAQVSSGTYASSAGAIETISLVRVTNLAQSLMSLKEAGFWAVAAEAGPKSTGFDKLPSFEHVALVLGQEWEGLSPLIRTQCDWALQIPVQGKIESLNVSAAGAILMYGLNLAKRP